MHIIVNGARCCASRRQRAKRQRQCRARGSLRPGAEQSAAAADCIGPLGASSLRRRRTLFLLLFLPPRRRRSSLAVVSHPHQSRPVRSFVPLESPSASIAYPLATPLHPPLSLRVHQETPRSRSRGVFSSRLLAARAAGNKRLSSPRALPLSVHLSVLPRDLAILLQTCFASVFFLLLPVRAQYARSAFSFVVVLLAAGHFIVVTLAAQRNFTSRIAPASLFFFLPRSPPSVRGFASS